MPQYLSNLLSIKESNNYSLRSASNGLILEDPTCRFNVRLGDRSFKASAPRTWNGLPREIRDHTNITMLKTMLKTHLFRSRRAYYYFFFNCLLEVVTGEPCYEFRDYWIRSTYFREKLQFINLFLHLDYHHPWTVDFIWVVFVMLQGFCFHFDS